MIRSTPSLKAVLLSAVTIGAAMPSMASAQTTSAPSASQLSIDGLALGMTMDQARAAIKANNPDMTVLTGYLTENIPGESGPQYYAALSNDVILHSGPLMNFKNSKIKVPVELTAIKFVGYDTASGAPITDNNAVLGNYGGDFLTLEFTPTDNGGQLYAVVKTHYYPQPSGQASGPPPGVPTINQIMQTAQQKYGSPSKTDSNYNNLYWVYDSRGRLLPGTHPNVQTCLRDVSIRNGTRGSNVGAGGGMVPISTSSIILNPLSGYPEPDTFKLTTANVNNILQQAAKDTSGDDLDSQYKSTVDSLVQSLISSGDAGFEYPPLSDYADSSMLASCNTTLLEVDVIGAPTPWGYQEILMKEKTALYDNGAPEYVQQKLSQANGNQPPAAAPNL